MNSFPIKIERSNLLFRLSLTTRRWRKILDDELQTSGLTDATWRPLLHLLLLGDGTRQKDLADSLGIKGPSLVRLLDVLLARGLVRRVEDETDRRAKLLFLTPEGQAEVNRIQETILALENELFGNLGKEEVVQMERFITRLETIIGAIDKNKTP